MEDNIFKRLQTTEKLPEDAKDELVSKIESAKLFQSFTELFSTEYFDVLSDLFRTKK